MFLSASLLFFVQPMFAKMVLPYLGGVPAVWTTAMLFFQTALLVGYAYAHFISTRLALRHQVMAHTVLWACGLAFLPLAVPAGWASAPDFHPAVQTLAILVVGMGVPFVALAANAPLLQKWYARTGAPAAADPYHLYAASNAGSLLALLAYPLVAEPLIGTRALSIHWSVGYLILGAGLALTAVIAARGGGMRPVRLAGLSASRPSASRVALWLALAFVPSSMMLGVTSVISSDLGAFPLVWVIPLAIYLLTFILAFSSRLRVPQGVVEAGFMVSVSVVIVAMAHNNLASLGWLGFGLLCGAFFFVALLFHVRLYDSRPPESALTWFYLAMATGGALGGLFNSIIAPVIFNQTLEVYVVFGLAGLALTGRFRPKRDTLAAGCTLLLLGALPAMAISAGLAPAGVDHAHWTITILAGAALYLGWKQPLRYTITAAIVLAGGFALHGNDGVVERQRSFFGVYTVRDYPADGLRALISGTTQHGLQFTEDLGKRPRILSYYHPAAPLGQIFRSGAIGPSARVGMVGLGVGALACYAGPGQTWRFYEIDPVVDDIARNSNLFNYMEKCGRDAATIIGDARITLAREAPEPFDILVMDAFTSDAIPVHLLTLEALDLYRSRLAPGGLLALHVSNRYYDLVPLLANAAARLGLHALVQNRTGGPDAPLEAGEAPSMVVLMAPDPEALARFARNPAWRAMHGDGRGVWTDDHANLLSAL
ncbi:MAG TPA: fused MFS/spermidine synthase [Thermohalobaculum sp.]|nr:fused MFS/spermidine synthase [Thermohalobaculum sp.]